MKKRMLIVEDEEAFVKTIKLLIGRAIPDGYDLEIAYDLCANYQEAVDTLGIACEDDAIGYDLVVVDFRIPIALRSFSGYPGLDICRLIRERYPKIQYLPISRLLKEVEDSSGYESYRDDIAKAVGKEDKEKLVTKILELLIGDPRQEQRSVE